MLTWPVATVGWVTSIVQQADASQKRINEFLSQKNDIVANNYEEYDFKGEIAFKNVCLTYKETNIKALDKINFKIDKYKNITLVKSSIRPFHKWFKHFINSSINPSDIYICKKSIFALKKLS